MQDHSPAPLVACVNASEDIVELLAEVMKHEGFRAVTHVSPSKLGPEPTIEFLRQVQPQACIYSVSIPYEDSWANFQQVREALPLCAWVVTTTNKRALDELVGPTNTIEIIGKPYDIDRLIDAVRLVLVERRD